MWLSFAVAVVASVVVLYLPGYLVLRAARLPRAWAFPTAPLLSVAACALTGEALGAAHVAASPLAVLAPPCALALAALLARRATHAADLDIPAIPLPELALAAGGGTAVALYFFVSNLSSPELIFPSIDIVHHINAVRAFLESQRFSSFAQDAYMTQADLAIDPYPGTSFYPSAWHALVALAAQLSGADVPIAINAFVTVSGSLVFPLAMVPFSATVFCDLPRVRLLAPLASVSFAIFPWALFVFGPIFPNFLGFCIVPAEVWLLLRTFGAHAPRAERLTCAGLALAGVVALGLLHPNTVFTCGVWVAPYLVHRAARGLAEASKPPLAQVAGGLAVAVGCVAAWITCLNLPFFQDVLSSVWASYASKGEALANVALLGYTRGFWPQPHLAAQPVLAALVLAGAVRTLRDRDRLWLACAYALAALSVVAASSIEPPAKNWLAGFWYTDPFRVGSMAAMFGVPLAAYGLEALCRLPSLVGRRKGGATPPDGRPRALGREGERLTAPAWALVTACLVGIFVGNFPLPGGGTKVTAFGALAEGVGLTYGLDDLYSLEEREFVARAKAAMPEGALVANYPYDGSLIAYGASGLRTYWRFVYGYGDPAETPESAVVRERLADVATDAEVRDALAAEGIEYVLLLHVDEGSTAWFVGYDQPQAFPGVLAVNDETPGLQTVLSEGDMRLYRVV